MKYVAKFAHAHGVQENFFLGAKSYIAIFGQILNSGCRYVEKVYFQQLNRPLKLVTTNPNPTP